MALATTHTDSLQITVQLQPPFPATIGFSTLLLLELQADNSSGNRVVSYTQSNVDQIESDWTTRIYEAAQTYFAQRPGPNNILVGAWDKGGGESVADALDAIKAADGGWFFVSSTIRAGADQNSISNTIESYGKPSIYFLQSSDSDIVTTNNLGSTGSALDPVPGRERTFGIYHPNDNENADAAMAGIIAPRDPDRKSAPFFGRLRGVSAYAANGAGGANALPAGASIGTAQSPGNIRQNNFNAVLPFGSAPAWEAPGQNANGRQGKVILTQYWFEDRLQANIANEIQTAQAQGEIIPIGAVGESQTEGQERMAKLLKNQYQLGAAADHFLPENLEITYPTIQQSDINQDVIPLSAEMTVAIGGQAVSFDIFFGREPV